MLVKSSSSRSFQEIMSGDMPLESGAIVATILVGVALAAGFCWLLNSPIDTLLGNLSEDQSALGSSLPGGVLGTSLDSTAFVDNPYRQSSLNNRGEDEGGTKLRRLSQNDTVASTKDQLKGDIQAALGNGDTQVGTGDLESAVGDVGADADSSTGVADPNGLLGLHDGDLVNKVVILLQYIQLLGIFLTPDFYVELPLVWLKAFGWIVFINLDIGTLAVDVDVGWVSFFCSLCYQPAILFWWWAVDSGYVEQWMSEHGTWFSVDWLTDEVWIQEGLQCLNLDVYDLDDRDNIRSFTVITLILPLLLLIVLGSALAPVAGSAWITAVVFLGTLLTVVNGLVWVRYLVRTFMKESYSVRFPNDANDEHFVREAKCKELHVILLFYLAAYITPLLGFIANISSGSDASLAVLSCLLLPTYALGPVLLLTKICRKTLENFPEDEYQDETKFKQAIQATARRASLEWNRIRVSAKHGVEIIRTPSVTSGELEATGKRLEYGRIAGYIRMLEKRDENTDTEYKFYELVDGSGWVADRLPSSKEVGCVSVVDLHVKSLAIRNLHGHPIFKAPGLPLSEDSQDRLKFGQVVRVAYTEAYSDGKQKTEVTKWYKLADQAGWFNNKDNVCKVSALKPGGTLKVEGGKLPIYKSVPGDSDASSLSTEPPHTGLYFDPEISGSSVSVEPKTFFSREVREPGVVEKKTVALTFWKLSSGDGWICSSMHQAPDEVDDDNNARKATGAGRAILISLVAPFERHMPLIKPALMMEKLAAAIIVVGIGSSQGMGTWLGFVFTLLCSGAAIYGAPFISEAEDKMDIGQRSSTTFFTLLGALLQESAFGEATETIGAALLFINSIISMAFLLYAMDPVGVYHTVVGSIRHGRAMAIYARMNKDAIESMLYNLEFNADLPKTAERLKAREAWLTKSLDELAVSCLTDDQLYFVVLYGGELCLKNPYVTKRLTAPAMVISAWAAAAHGGHIEVMEHIIETQPSIAANKAMLSEGGDRTPLMLAASGGSLDACKFVAKHNNGRSDLTLLTNSMNALHHMLDDVNAHLSDGRDILAIADFLVHGVGIDVNAKTADYGVTALQIICQSSSNINRLHVQNCTISEDTVDKMGLELAKKLVEWGGNVLLSDEKSEKRTCLHHHIVDFGDHRKTVSEETIFGLFDFLKLTWAEQWPTNGKKHGCDQDPMKAKDEDGNTLLHCACDDECSERRNPRRALLAQKLISDGADIHALDENGHSPIWKACAYSENFALVKLLVGMDGALAKIPGLLHEVTQASSWKRGEEMPSSQCMLTFLLDSGADIRDTDDEGKTPLHSAINGSNEHAVKVLLAYGGASLTMKDQDGKTPLDIARDELKDNPNDKEIKNIAKMVMLSKKNRRDSIRASATSGGDAKDLSDDSDDSDFAWSSSDDDEATGKAKGTSSSTVTAAAAAAADKDDDDGYDDGDNDDGDSSDDDNDDDDGDDGSNDKGNEDADKDEDSDDSDSDM